MIPFSRKITCIKIIRYERESERASEKILEPRVSFVSRGYRYVFALDTNILDLHL